MLIRNFMRQRWIPALFVLGFLVTVGVNAVLIVAAGRTFSGLVVSHPYAKGVEYSANLKALTEQRSLQWRHHVMTLPAADGSVVLQVRWTDAAGAPLPGLQVIAQLERPVERLDGISVQVRDQGEGLYSASITLPRAGIWDLHLTAMHGERKFTVADRIQVP